MKSSVEGYGKKVIDFFSVEAAEPAPGDSYLQQAFMVEPPPATPGAPIPPPKELAALILNGFKAGLGANSLPGFIETIITEVTTVNNEFLREAYKKLMERPAVQPINDLEMYEAARRRMLDRLVAIVMDKIELLQRAKDFQIQAQGKSVAPGAGLLDKGMDELNQEVLRRLNVALELTMGELVDKLEGLRQQCETNNALAMEAYLGIFPWMLALNFRNTFMPVWQLIMDNTFGKVAGPLGDVVLQARDAMNQAKSKVDDARTYGERIKRIKDRAMEQGVKVGDEDNTAGYAKDMKYNLPPDQPQPKPEVVAFFPFSGRVPAASGQEIKKTEYEQVKPKFETASDPNAPVPA